jgi:hypothetical protein
MPLDPFMCDERRARYKPNGRLGGRFVLPAIVGVLTHVATGDSNATGGC